MSETIDTATARRMAEAGTILGVSVIGQPGGWSVILKMDRTQKPLGAQKADRPRTWRSLDTLTEYLRKDLHIVHIDAVDGTHYSSAGATRPDAAARMKRAHEAAAHDAWFRAEVDAGIKEADDPATEWVPHSKVMADLDNRIARYEKALAKGAK